MVSFLVFATRRTSSMLPGAGSFICPYRCAIFLAATRGPDQLFSFRVSTLLAGPCFAFAASNPDNAIPLRLAADQPLAPGTRLEDATCHIRFFPVLFWHTALTR